MLERYFKFLEEKFIKTYANNRLEYVYKTPPESLKQFHDEMMKKKTIFWTPEKLAIINHRFGATKEELEDYKKREQFLLDHASEYRFKVEPIPKWYFKLLSTCQALEVLRGSFSLNSNPIDSMLEIKPEALNGMYFIGDYYGMPQESCPIFTDESGHIYVINAKEYRNYPHTDKEKDIQKYLKSKVKLVKEWDNIEDFLIEETARLEPLYAQQATLYGVKPARPSGEGEFFERQ